MIAVDERESVSTSVSCHAGDGRFSTGHEPLTALQLMQLIMRKWDWLTTAYRMTIHGRARRDSRVQAWP